ncbi:hypothetical protein Q427_30215 [Halomonas sp. BC04]|nr:hypothetical protein Q427_30215 [Halomonas sp. BC04]
MPVRLDEGLLSHILHFTVILDVASDQPDDLVLILPYQQVERTRIALLGAFHELLVGLSAAHSRPPRPGESLLTDGKT